uniref:Uncharacterized protein n=1 Tax=Arundo donax TaxID=35708 RepID=A0A0A8XZJ0_ARUDO
MQLSLDTSPLRNFTLVS